MTDLGAGLGLLLAFAAGVVSFASPCCLPLVPAYLGYMAGATAGETPDRRRALFHGLAFCLGFTVVFVAFWASIGAIGYLLADNARYLRQAGGLLLVVFGLQVAGVINIRALFRDTRPLPTMSFGGAVTAGGPGFGAGTTTAPAPAYGRSLLLGTFFAAGWSPCIGPILGGIIGLASATESVAQGTVLLIAYAAGLALPFLAVALGASWVTRRMAWFGRHHHAVSLATGSMLVAIGVLMFTDLLGRLATVPSPFGL